MTGHGWDGLAAFDRCRQLGFRLAFWFILGLAFGQGFLGQLELFCHQLADLLSRKGNLDTVFDFHVGALLVGLLLADLLEEIFAIGGRGRELLRLGQWDGKGGARQLTSTGRLLS